MSWSAGQSMLRGPKPLGAMMGAVFMASQKPLAEQALQHVHELLAQVPGDVDWLAFQAGVQRYMGNPWRQERPVYPVVGTAGRVTLRDAGGTGRPVVLVPSMVNRGYVLDLYPGHSLTGFLRDSGFRVLLLDWGEPVAGEGGDGPLTMDQVVMERLVPLLRAAAEAYGPLSLFGYCMGGLLALAAAVHLPPTVAAKLAVAAMPWDFSVTPSSGHMAMARPVMEPWLQAQGIVPAEVMQQYFWLLDPWSPVRRLSAYGAETHEEKHRFMTAMEDWLADGLALDGPVAREILIDWYADNRTLKGAWVVGGKTVTPQALDIPLLAAVTQRDTLVPSMCSLPFVGQSKGAQVVMADTGHVGLVCGRRAKDQLFEPLGRWLSA